MPAAKTTPAQAPEVEPVDELGIIDENANALGHVEEVDLGYADAISEQVGRHGFLVNYSAPECLVPSDDGNDEELALFDRYYFPVDGAEPVLVDLVPGGSDHERAQQEADRHCARKREWCESRGIRYLVVVGSTW